MMRKANCRCACALILILLVLVAAILMANNKEPVHGRYRRRLTEGFATDESDVPRILCAVHTNPGNHKARALHIRNTWGKRCSILVFVTSGSSDSAVLSSSLVNIGERNDAWEKSAASFPIIYDQYFDRADWFFKCDDDTYVIMENLRHLVRTYSADEPVYFAFPINMHTPQGYPEGGSGYIMSREALRRLVTRGYLGDPPCCKPPIDVYEDVEVGRCLWEVNVTMKESRDEQHRHRFLPPRPHDIMVPQELQPGKWGQDFIKWQQKHAKYPLEQGSDCCSDSAISFHDVSPQDLYVFDYFIYGIKQHLRAEDGMRRP